MKETNLEGREFDECISTVASLQGVDLKPLQIHNSLLMLAEFAKYTYPRLGHLVLFKHPTKQPPFLLEERNRSRCYLGPSLTSVHQWFVSLMCTALLTLPSFPSERLSTLPFKSPDADRSSWGGNDVQRVNIHWD